MAIVIISSSSSARISSLLDINPLPRLAIELDLRLSFSNPSLLSYTVQSSDSDAINELKGMVCNIWKRAAFPQS